MIETLAWVTASAARGHDTDERLALAALAQTGVSVDVVDWDDAGVDWARYDRVVLRSAWDYVERLEPFLAWVDAVGAVTDLRNPRETVRWSVDKSYLVELASAGVPVVPTTVVVPGDEPSFPPGEIVVKPAVGAGSRDAASYGPEDLPLARAHARRLHEDGRTVVAQPLLASVAADGEWALVFLGGTFSHAANKRVDLPRASAVQALFAPETTAPHVPDADQLAVAGAAVEHVVSRFGTPTYARVDLVRGDAGEPLVLEVELVEPTLFLQRADVGAPMRLARALTA